MAGSSGVVGAISALAGKFDPLKHTRGQHGKFAFQGGTKKKAGKGSGSVASAHALFDKMKGHSKKDVLAAAAAAGINPNTAKTQLYHWQKKQAEAALAGIKNPTKEQMQEAVASAIGVKGAKAPTPEAKPEPKPTPKPAPKPAPETKPQPAPSPVTGPNPKALENYHILKDKADKSPGEAHFVKSMEEVYPHIKTAPDLAKLGPTKYVHALADHMKDATAKEVKAAAVKAGVNKSTASVQYSKWKAKQEGVAPQLKTSPEPKALQAKQPAQMTDAELDKAVDSYFGKVNVPSEAETYTPKPYNHNDTYHDYEGGKALTAKLKIGNVYTNQQQGKTFYKAHNGDIYEHTGSAGTMTKVAGSGNASFHYDPATKMVYSKSASGVLHPMKLTETPVFKNNQPPPDENNHYFKDHSWSTISGVHNPDSTGVTQTVLDVHKKAGVIYNDTNPVVKSYTNNGYKSINDALRESKGQTVGTSAKVLDGLIAKSSFQEETIMWRGVGEKGKVWNGAPPPPEVDDYGFTSVSFKPSVAKGFSDGKTMFRVRVPKGFPGLNVAIGSPGSGVAGLQSEAEVILPRGTTYRVVERHKQAAGSKYGEGYGSKMDVVDLEPVLPQWYIEKYGQPKIG
jgi:hypothetical protein